METKTKDVYQIVTNRIIQLLEQKIVPWRQPWIASGLPQNLITKKHYRGINVLLLNSLNYSQNYFVTYNQIHQLGAKVKEGEKPHFVVFWKWLDKNGEEREEGKKPSQIPMLRYYQVLNIAQVEGIQEDRLPQKEQFNPVEIDHSCEEIIANIPMCPPIEFKGSEAYYLPLEDKIVMPSREFFKSKEGYYQTLFHELVHSTGHASRLNRSGITEKAKFGSKEYSKEELIGEIGASFMCHHAGFDKPEIENSASYIQSWLKVLQNDKKFIISASVQAQKAADYLMGIAEPVLTT